MTEEIWKPIPEFERYFASNFGRIKRLNSPTNKKTERILKGKIRGGYLAVRLKTNSTFKVYKIHRLVLQVFRPMENKKLWGLHGDDNRLNNHLDNLRWGTPQENSLDAIKNNKLKAHNGPRGPRRRPRLSPDEVIEIRTSLDSTTILAKRLNVSRQAISLIKKFKLYKVVSKNIDWKDLFFKERKSKENIIKKLCENCKKTMPS